MHSHHIYCSVDKDVHELHQGYTSNWPDIVYTVHSQLCTDSLPKY